MELIYLVAAILLFFVALIAIPLGIIGYQVRKDKKESKKRMEEMDMKEQHCLSLLSSELIRLFGEKI